VSDPRDQLQVGLADRYVLERELGRGGMAVVYLAHDLKHKRSVALKVLHPGLAAALGPERFQREIELAARLQHPHILPVFDSGDAAGQLWFTMPLVEGESLRDCLNREKQLPVEDALRIATDAARALQCAHQHGIIHRDIKPENLLLTKDGSTLVADFGIARAVGGVQDQLTQTGISLGTPAYMSPEQASGDRTLDARTDVYSLGCVLYEMLAGEPPYSGPTAQAIIAKRFTDPVPSVHRMRPSVSLALDELVQRALAPLAADRFATARDFLRALASVQLNSAAVPTRETVVKPTRHPVVLGLAALGLIAAAGGVLWWRSRANADPTGPTRVAVLPFENLGDSADAYFADGMSDAVRGKLTALDGLEVIARASSMTFRHTSEPPEEVARELGVRYLLTGTVRWARSGGANRVQVRPELVEVRRAGPPASKWQQAFDAGLTDVFQVQADIASRVAQALDVALGTQEQQQLVQRPTVDLAAYDAFLKGEAAAHALAAEDLPSFRRAATLYLEAVTHDSMFGLAWARLAEAHALLYGYGSHTQDEAEASRNALGRAEYLVPTAPETSRALAGYLELVRRDFRGALAAAEAGLARAPENSELMAVAAIQEWRLGRIDAAVVRFTRAQTVDPRSVIVLNYLGAALLHRRRWSEARRAIAHALSFSPTNLTPLVYGATTYLGEGDLAAARRVLTQAPPAIDRVELAANMAAEETYWGLDEASQDRVIGLQPSAFDDNRALWALVRAQLLHLRGDTARARVYADTARIEYAALLPTNPDDQVLHSHYGLALAYLGRKAEAIREGKRGVELLPVGQDGIWGPRAQHQLARIYLLVGEPEKALDQLEPLLKIPYYLSPGWLRIDPTFDPLRGNPRFQRMVNAEH
jgi:eukaryotic-like serine/threonine-protein kinase